MPLQPMVTMGQAVPMQPMEIHSETEILMEDSTLEQVDVPEGVCAPMGSLSWQDL